MEKFYFSYHTEQVEHRDNKEFDGISCVFEN